MSCSAIERASGGGGGSVGVSVICEDEVITREVVSMSTGTGDEERVGEDITLREG